MYIFICEIDHQSRFIALDRVLRAGTGMTQRDGMGMEVVGRFSMGNTCPPMEDSFHI